jgi:heat shock protein HslJ
MLPTSPFALASMLGIGLGIVLSCCACASAGAPEPEPLTDLAETDWVCVALEGQTVAPDSGVSLRFDAEGGISGRGGVNRLFGSYARLGAGLSISGVGATRMAGPEEYMELEQRYLAALERVDSFQATAASLRLLEGSVVLVQFERAESESL